MTEIPTPDDALLRAAAGGDEEALETLYARCLDGLFAFIFYRVGQDRELAKDVVADVFVWALEHADAYDAERGALVSWMRGGARNIIRRHLRDRRRETLVHQFERLDQELAAIFDDLGQEPLSDEVLARQETRDLVNITIGHLPEHYRQLLERKYIAGESLRELAQEAGQTEQAIKSRLNRARQAFREAFAAVCTTFAEVP